MEWVNYHHLLYFWMVAREGSLVRAAAALRLAPSTVSKQIHLCERALGHPLFRRSGRRLILTESGQIALRYADEIFGLGRELLSTLRDRPTGRPLRVNVGITDVVPKLIAERVLTPAFALAGPLRLVCREDRSERLLAELALHELDVVLNDAPVSPGGQVRAFSHLLGESAVALFGTAELVRKVRRGFPASLQGVPLLLPTENTALRRSLDAWLESGRVQPTVVGEFEDSALLKAFGSRGLGLFPAPMVIAREVEAQYQVRRLAELPGVRERLYAITVERRIEHPAVVAICESARSRVYGGV